MPQSKRTTTEVIDRKQNQVKAQEVPPKIVLNPDIENSAPNFSTWQRSCDGMFHRRIEFNQHKKGYRFSVDAVLLSDFVAQTPAQPTLDFGCGCGVVMIALATLWKAQGFTPQICGIERQSSLFQLTQENIEINGFLGQLKVKQHDLRKPLPKQVKWNLIVCNPPYKQAGSGQQSPNPERAAARHELNGTLEQFIKTGRKILTPEGRFCFIYPTPLLPKLFSALHQNKLHPSRIRMVHPYADKPSNLILLEATKKFEELTTEPPLVLYTAPRVYTKEAQLILQGRYLPDPSSSF